MMESISQREPQAVQSEGSTIDEGLRSALWSGRRGLACMTENGETDAADVSVDEWRVHVGEENEGVEEEVDILSQSRYNSA
jgi:hypothetical protein